MQTLIYEGKIEPEAAPLTLDYRPKFLRQETETAPEAEYEVTVCQSEFKTDPLSASNIDPLCAEQARRCVVFI